MHFRSFMDLAQSQLVSCSDMILICCRRSSDLSLMLGPLSEWVGDAADSNLEVVNNCGNVVTEVLDLFNLGVEHNVLSSHPGAHMCSWSYLQILCEKCTKLLLSLFMFIHYRQLMHNILVGLSGRSIVFLSATDFPTRLNLDLYIDDFICPLETTKE